MRDLKYIVKRILIGVGIVLVLGFINSAKASALTFDNMTLISDFRIRPNTEIYSLYYDSTNNKYCIDNPRGTDECVSNATDFPYLFCWNWKSLTGSDFASAINGVSSSDQVFCFFTDKPISYLYNSGPSTRFLGNNSSFNYKYISVNYGNGTAVPNDSAITTSLNSTYNKYFIKASGSSSPRDFPRNGIILSNFDVYNFSDNSLYYGANLSFIPGVQVPTIESLQPTKVTNNNVITGYIFRPKFSSFDTSNYDYQYKFGKDSTTWLGLSSNEQQLKFNANGELYVRIKDKNSGDIIDTVTFVIVGLGSFNENVDYNINFSGEYRTSNYLNNSNTSSKSISTIEEYQIYVDYFPKTSILKYQYQYVNLNDSLDNNNWQNVSSSDNGSFTYVANNNGTLYARILDNEDNVLYTSTFTVNSIGLLAFDNSEGKFEDFFTSLRNKIDYGGPIGSLINIPITLLQTISDSFNGMTGVCSNYNLGSLFGHNIYLPCVNVKHYLGDTLYNTIDIIISCCMIYCIFKMLSTAYYQFLLLESTPIPEDMSNSLNVSYRRW